MSSPIITVENLTKCYKLGQIGATTLRDSVQRIYHRLRGQDPDHVMGKVSPSATPLLNNSLTDTFGGKFWALNDVSFEVHPGEVLGIIGRNGAGKSTLLKILTRITEPTSGRAIMRGRVASLLEVGTGFHPELTGRENVFLNGAILGMKRAEVAKKFDEIVAFSEVEKFIDTPVKRYSSGMYVRLAFAVAAHLEPEILLVDEVLAVGDAGFQKKCLGKMGEVGKHGRTVLFVSHNMQAIKMLCARVIALETGELMADGSAVQVVNKYMEMGRITPAQKVWDDLIEPPKNDLFVLRGVAVMRDGKLAADIPMTASFEIVIDYETREDNIRCGTTVALYTPDGMCLLSSIGQNDPLWGKQRMRGLYSSRCTIPANLLNEGAFSVTFLIFSDGYTNAIREDACVEFNIYDDGMQRDQYFGGWAGVVRPILSWRTEAKTISSTTIARGGARP
jgi:lipopolysaccharide transport system ATP-binding protein